MLFTKCILDEPLPHYGDGVRVSVMSRHTLSDGTTPDVRIDEGKFDIHLPRFAPSASLVGNYYKRGLSWSVFEKMYIEEIRSDKNFFSVIKLARLAMRMDITLLCIEDEPKFCHRRLLAEQCQLYEPRLRIEHR